MKVTAHQLKIINVYLRFAKKNKIHPTRSSLIKEGISRDRIRLHFGNFNGLKTYIKKNHSDALINVIDDEVYSKKNVEKINENLSKFKRFVITTVVTGAKVHKGFLSSIETYCKARDATLLVLLATDPASANNEALDPLIADKNLVLSEVSLNSNLYISTIKLSAKQIDPITGLSRIGQRNGSFIYASPKQRMKPTANSNIKLPHVLMTTGALTKPAYGTTKYMSDRTAYIAENDHVLGAIIVEIENDVIFHYRQVQANKSGHFADLGKMYCKTEITDYAPAAFVLGDWHSGETDPTAAKAWAEVVSELQVPEIILHDGLNGKAFNHHEEHNRILRAQLAAVNKLSLEQELRDYAKDLDQLSDKSLVTISRSNHDDFLDYYLSEAKYTEDAHNYLFASKLVTAMIEGKNPLKYALETLIGLKNPRKIRFLEMDEDYKIAGIEIGAHGHKGGNGARGNLKTMEMAYGLSVSGHSHVPEILRGAWSVGTSSYLKLNYNQGPSGWMHCSCLVYPNGMRQLINSISGKWHLKD